MKAKIDQAGRIVLPKALREKLELVAGDLLELERRGTQIILSPVIEHAKARKKNGAWVFRSATPLTTESVRLTLEETRDERENR